MNPRYRQDLVANIRPSLGERSIVLVGMMGSGKTSVGRRLAARLALQFTDCDREIEMAANLTVQEIFDRYGEIVFRSLERRVIARVINTPSQVIALGGGAWASAETRSAVSTKCISIWLDPDLATLAKRVQLRDTRPLLKGHDPSFMLSKLDRERRPVYAQANIHIPVGQASRERVAEDVIEGLCRFIARNKFV